MILNKINNAEHLKGIIDSTMDAIISIDLNQNIVLFNKAAEKMFLVTAEEAVNQHINKFIPTDFHESHTRYVEQFGRNNKTFRKMGRLAAVKALRSNGDVFPAEAAISHSGEGKEKIYTVILRDVSNRVEIDKEIKNYIDELTINKNELEKNSKELQRLNKELEESNLNKNKLFSIIAHDLKSPFTALLGLAEFLKLNSSELSPEEITDFSSRLHGSLKNVLRLVENLLEWSRIQSDSIEFDPIRFDLEVLFSDLYPIFKVVAENKQIELINNLQQNIYVFADRNMIELILRNLLSNAIKFTPKGGKVTISSEEKENGIFIKIVDTGIGISKKDLDNIFNIDRNIRRSGTANEKGTGLGLILCKEFVEMNGGSCYIESDEGIGSTFAFSIPKTGRMA